jgi:hypothetical protein
MSQNAVLFHNLGDVRATMQSSAIAPQTGVWEYWCVITPSRCALGRRLPGTTNALLGCRGSFRPTRLAPTTRQAGMPGAGHKTYPGGALPCVFCSIRASRVVSWCLTSLILACSFAIPRPARAQGVYVYGPPPGSPPPPPPRYSYYAYRQPAYVTMLAVDVEGAVPLNVAQFTDRNGLYGGGGFKFRAGEQIRLRSWLRITPEIGYGYEHLFATNAVYVDGTSNREDLDRVFAGARLSFGQLVQPGVYAHVGYGWKITDGGTQKAGSGFAYDAGAALDFHFVPRLDIGAHFEYARIAQPYWIQWLALGVHAAILL